MYEVNRIMRVILGVSGPERVASPMVWALSLLNKANEIFGDTATLTLWSSTYSPGNGTLIWTTTGEKWTDLEALNAKMAASREFLKVLAEGVIHTSDHEAVNDTLFRVAYAPQGFDGDAANFVVSWQVEAAPGKLERIGDLGVDTAQRLTAVTGAPTTFATGQTGRDRTFEWKTYHSSIEDLAASRLRLETDKDFLKFLDTDAAECFATGSTRILRRVRV